MLLPGLLIIGGSTGGATGGATSAEFWHPTLPPCSLPMLSQNIMFHTVNILLDSKIITCHKDTCEVFKSGGWVTLVNTTEYRVEHSSVETIDGLVLLGGLGTNTTEVIPTTGAAAQPGTFDIEHGSGHCTIQLAPDLLVLTGGSGLYANGSSCVAEETCGKVTEIALVERGASSRPLAHLTEGRYWHACSWYYRDQQKVAFHGFTWCNLMTS